MGSGEKECKYQVADDKEHSSEDEHGGTFTFAVEEVAEEGGDDSGSDGEPSEDVGSRFRSDAVKVALKHVSTIALEGENGGVVENAEESNNPEGFAGKDGSYVADLEFFFRFAVGLFAKLFVEFLVENTENEEEDKIDRASAVYKKDSSKHENGSVEYFAERIPEGKLLFTVSAFSTQKDEAEHRYKVIPFERSMTEGTFAA
mgnify:CR=1 FL=1